MSQEAQLDAIRRRTVVLSVPEMDAVSVRRGVPYRRSAGDEALALDLYYPPDAESRSGLPALVFVLGYPDEGMRRVLGCAGRELGQYTSWARLAAAGGMVGVTYATRDPAADGLEVLRHLRENAPALGLDAARIGLWSCSGNVPTALSALAAEAAGTAGAPVRGAVLAYGMMLDWEGSTLVADAAKGWGFAPPRRGLAVADLPRETPLLVVRAGADEVPHLNATIDRFVADALALDLPLTLVNQRNAPHGFDAILDDEATRQVIRGMLEFLRFYLEACT